MKNQKLTVGMATYDDYIRTKFTATNLMIQNKEDIFEIIIVDNNPGSTQGMELAKWANGACRIRYVPFTDYKGTAGPRNKIFELTNTPYVMCVDPHVLIPKEGIKALVKFYEDHPDCADLIHGPLMYDNQVSFSTHFNAEWGGGMLGKWDTREGWEEYDYFEIPAMGLGLFACRKDAWLGFNPRFRGFGAEEWTIHEKFRKVGRKVLCLTELKWWHDFTRLEKPPYPLSNHDKVRNYVIAFTELGDTAGLEQVRKHFKITDDNQWNEYLAIGRGEKEDIVKNVNVVKRAESLVPVSNCKTGKCGEAVSVQDWYNRSVSTSSDINEHVKTLSELAKGQKVVVEMGVRTGVSTSGLVYGKPEKLVCYDLNASPSVDKMRENIKEYGVDFEFIQGDSLLVDIPECDLLFIDTKHTGRQVLGELNRHAKNVRKRIAFHDTEIFGMKGEDGSEGLLSGIVAFLRANREWQVIRHDANNNGFTVISKDQNDFPKVPAGFVEQTKAVARFGKAEFKRKLDGGKYLPLEIAQERYNTCLMCPQRASERCSKCSCYLFQIPENMKVRAGQPGKIFYPHEVCPLGKWFDQSDKGVPMSEEEIKEMMINLGGGELI